MYLNKKISISQIYLINELNNQNERNKCLTGSRGRGKYPLIYSIVKFISFRLENNGYIFMY